MVGRSFEVGGRSFEVVGRSFEMVGRSFEVVGRSFEVGGRSFEAVGRSFEVVGDRKDGLFTVWWDRTNPWEPCACSCPHHTSLEAQDACRPTRS